MIHIDLNQIPIGSRFDFAYLDNYIIDCLACRKRVKTTEEYHLHICKRCGSEAVKVIKGWRIPYRTLAQARDEGKLLVYPGNPTETNSDMLADWRNFPSVVKKHSRNQIKTNKRSNIHNETHHQARAGTGSPLGG